MRLAKEAVGGEITEDIKAVLRSLPAEREALEEQIEQLRREALGIQCANPPPTPPTQCNTRLTRGLKN
jgi:cell division protein FtsB